MTFRCNVPGDPDAELHWRKEDGEQFRNEITDDEGVLTITDVQPSDAGAYICTADDPDGPIESPLVYLIVNPRICMFTLLLTFFFRFTNHLHYFTFNI